MDRVFNYDNKFFRGISVLVDCVIISVCWMLMCIPVFTIGAASAAMYDTVHKTIRRDKGYVWSGFWKSFRENFKPATKAWLIHLLILIVLGGDLYITSQALPVLIVILPALAAIFYEFILEKVFRKVMTPEDLAKEQEEDRFDKDL